MLFGGIVGNVGFRYLVVSGNNGCYYRPCYIRG